MNVNNIMNNTHLTISLIVCITFSIFTISVLSFDYAYADDEKEILIASWNLFTFGKTTSQTDEKFRALSEILDGSNYPSVDRHYDLIFVQELLSNGEAFDTLCQDYLSAMDYLCKKTDPVRGEGTRLESYGVIYKNTIDVQVVDTNHPNVEHNIPQGMKYDDGTMVRPPMEAKVTIGDFEFFVYNNHIKPSTARSNYETPEEIENLEDAIYRFHEVSDTNILVLGDLNADGAPTKHDTGKACGTRYMKGGFDNYPNLFSEPNWAHVFTFNDITNFAGSPCSYDKIIPNTEMHQFYDKHGIIGEFPESLLSDSSIINNPPADKEFGSPYKLNGEKLISDHRLIWAKFIIPTSMDTGNSDDPPVSSFVKLLMEWWENDLITEEEFRIILQYLVEQELIT